MAKKCSRLHWPQEPRNIRKISTIFAFGLIFLLYGLLSDRGFLPEEDRDALVTIIVPSKMRPTLGRTIDSLRRQHDPRWKAMVVVQFPGNDSLLENYHAMKLVYDDDARIKFLRYPGRHSSGNCASKLRMYGILRVDTNYVGFVDDDDVLDERYVTILSSYLHEQSEIDLVTFRAAFPQGFVTPPVGIKDVEISQIGISFALNATKMVYTAFRDTGCEDFDFLNRFCHFKGRCAFLSHIGYRVKAVQIDYKAEKTMNFVQVPQADDPTQLISHQKTYLDFLKDCKYPVGRPVLARFKVSDGEVLLPTGNWIRTLILRATKFGCYIGSECQSITVSVGSRCRSTCCTEVLLSYLSLSDIYHRAEYDYLLFQSLPLLPSMEDTHFTSYSELSKSLPRMIGPTCKLEYAQKILPYHSKNIDVFILARECNSFITSLCNYFVANGLHVHCEIPIPSQVYKDTLSRTKVIFVDPDSMDKHHEKALRLAVQKGILAYSVSGINLPFEYYYESYVIFTSRLLLPRLILNSVNEPFISKQNVEIQGKIQMESVCQSLRALP